jgi:hypothetical protein
VTAGWQENESEDHDLIDRLGVRAINLRLHARSEEVYAVDPEFSDAAKARQKRLQLMQEFYRVRLDYADDAARSIDVRHVDRALLDEQRRISIGELRHLDEDHLARVREVQEEFEARWRPGERDAIARHRDEVATLVRGCGALVIAGGHVASLLTRLRLFDLGRAVGQLPIVAWSAGAMVMTDRVVVFHDFPPYGKDIAQVLETGLGACHDVVVLPDASRRIRLDDRTAIARFASRMSPSTCVALDPGSSLVFSSGRLVRAQAERFGPDGRLERGWLR